MIKSYFLLFVPILSPSLVRFIGGMDKGVWARVQGNDFHFDRKSFDGLSILLHGSRCQMTW